MTSLTNPYNDYVDANGKEWKTFYVTNFEDNGSDTRPLEGSLRDAIKEGHGWNPYGYNIRIVFQTDKASENIELKSPLEIKHGDWNIEAPRAVDLGVSYDGYKKSSGWSALTTLEWQQPNVVFTVAPDSNIIESQSKILKEDSSKMVNLKYGLNPNKGYVIYQSIENGEKNMVTPSSSNDEQLLGAIRQHASYTFRTKSEQEIEDSRTSFFGSKVSKSMGSFVASQGASAAMGSEAALALKAKATAKVTAMAATTAGKATLGATGVFGAIAAIGIGALFHDSQETARIEAELAEKQAIDAEHDAFKAALPKRLEFNPINTLQTRRVNIYKDFDFTHRDSAYFLPAGMDTDISYVNQTDGRDVVRFSYIPKSLKDSSTVTNSAKEYAR